MGTPQAGTLAQNVPVRQMLGAVPFGFLNYPANYFMINAMKIALPESK
jgi:hypothetical protein